MRLPNFMPQRSEQAVLHDEAKSTSLDGNNTNFGLTSLQGLTGGRKINQQKDQN